MTYEVEDVFECAAAGRVVVVLRGRSRPAVGDTLHLGDRRAMIDRVFHMKAPVKDFEDPLQALRTGAWKTWGADRLRTVVQADGLDLSSLPSGRAHATPRGWARVLGLPKALLVVAS